MIEVGRIVQLRGPTPPYPHTKNMTTPSSCPAHKRKAKNEKEQEPLCHHRSISKKAHAHYTPHHIILLPPPTLIMPPRRTRQPPTHNLSWFSTPRRQVVLHRIHGLINERLRRNRHRLERFRHHIRAHDIPYFCASHQVYVQGPHSRQYFRTSLRSLLTLDYVPQKVKIPVHHLPHDCQFCPEVTRHTSQRRRPFDYVIATRQSRGRPRRQDTTEESDSPESDSDDEDSYTDDDSSDTRTSMHNESLPTPPESSPP